MDPVDLGSFTRQAAETAPAVIVVAQWLKQSPRIRNRWIPSLAPLIGILILLLGTIAAGEIYLTPDALHVSSWSMLLTRVLAGIAAGVSAVTGYEIQKLTGLPILQPGPNNHEADREIEPQPLQTQPPVNMDAPISDMSASITSVEPVSIPTPGLPASGSVPPTSSAVI